MVVRHLLKRGRLHTFALATKRNVPKKINRGPKIEINPLGDLGTGTQYRALEAMVSLRHGKKGELPVRIRRGMMVVKEPLFDSIGRVGKPIEQAKLKEELDNLNRTKLGRKLRIIPTLRALKQKGKVTALLTSRLKIVSSKELLLFNKEAIDNYFADMKAQITTAKRHGWILGTSCFSPVLIGGKLLPVITDFSSVFHPNDRPKTIGTFG